MPIQLPTQISEPKTSITEFTTLIYGPPKIGKSTFCSHAENTLFIATEPGLNHLKVYQTPCGSWSDFLEICKLLAAGKHNFKTVVIDTIDNLAAFCQDHTVRKLGIEHPSDLGYGKGWDTITTRLHRALTYLAMLPYGLLMISHSKEKEVKTRTGKMPKIAPTLSGKVLEVVTNLVDFYLYADVEDVLDEDNHIIGSQRVLHCQPTTMYDCGNRSQFEIPDPLPLDYNAFVKALAERKPKQISTTIVDTSTLKGGSK